MIGRSCLVCHSEHLETIAHRNSKKYFYCSICNLISMCSKYYLDSHFEKMHYDQHQNSIENKGYCSFLMRLIDPMVEFLDREFKGLDYGCGP
jgi:hypothetical protein